MYREALLVLHEYKTYANHLVLAAAAQLGAEDLDRAASPSHGSVRALLLHMLGCEAFFLSLCQGTSLDAPPPDGAPPALNQIEVWWDDLARQRAAYLESVTDAALKDAVPVPLGAQTYTLERWQLITQSLLHSGHHRGELSIVMTALGVPLPTLDVIIPFIQNSGQVWPPQG
jgi:uncharacterized damage-inducible protein DinB